jgi:hypothetical protein
LVVPGSLRLVGKPDVWELRAYAGRDAKGRVRHVYGKFRGTRRAAERALTELVADRKAHAAVLEDTIGAWGPKTTINEALSKRGDRTAGKISVRQPSVDTKASGTPTSATASVSAPSPV